MDCQIISQNQHSTRRDSIFSERKEMSSSISKARVTQIELSPERSVAHRPLWPMGFDVVHHPVLANLMQCDSCFECCCIADSVFFCVVYVLGDYRMTSVNSGNTAINYMKKEQFVAKSTLLYCHLMTFVGYLLER